MCAILAMCWEIRMAMDAITHVSLDCLKEQHNSKQSQSLKSAERVPSLRLVLWLTLPI